MKRISIEKRSKDFFLLSVAKVIQVSLGFLTIKYLTTFLSVEEVGKYYLLQAILSFFAFSFMNSFGQYFSRHIIRWRQSGNLLNALNALIFLRIVLSLFATIIAFFLYSLLSYDQAFNLPNFLLFIFFGLVGGTQLVFLSSINILGERQVFIKHLLATLLLGFATSILIVRFISNSAIGWISGPIVAQIVISSFSYKFLSFNVGFDFNRLKQVFNTKKIFSILSFTLPISLALLLQWGQLQSYRFIVEYRYGLEILAIVGVGMSVPGSVFSAAESILTQYFHPIYFKDITNASFKERELAWSKMSSFLIPIYSAILLFVLPVSPYLIRVFSSEKFHDALPFVMLGAFFHYFRAVTNVISMVSQSELKTGPTVLPYIVGITFSAAALMFCDFSDFKIGVILVLATSYALILCLMYLKMKQLQSIRFDLKKLIKTAIVSSLFMFNFYFSYSSLTFVESLIGITFNGLIFVWLFLKGLLVELPHGNVAINKL